MSHRQIPVAVLKAEASFVHVLWLYYRYRVQHRRKWATDVLRIILVPPQTYADRIQSVCYHANLRR